MKKFAILAWLLLPILAGAYHFGPGQRRLQMDDAAQHLSSAKRYADSEDWGQAVEEYEAALKLVPTEDVWKARRIQLALSKARMLNKQLPMAHKELLALVEELTLEQEENAGQSHQREPLTNEARSALANSQFYMTWLMRLEGAPRNEWEKHIDAARQHYKLLAESPVTSNPQLIKTAQHDLEAAIRLSRIDLADLQGLPIPNQ